MKLKSIASLILAALLACMMAAPAFADMTLVTGAWEINQGATSMEENAEAKAALEKALEGLLGAGYEAVAVLGRQVVAGTNYCILCKVTPVVPDAVSEWALVYVYENLEGSAEITNVVSLLAAPEAGMTGAWAPNQGDEALEADAKAALDAALENMVGADYETVAVLGSQVVAGMNYSLLCRVTPVTPDAVGSFAVVTVYRNLQGGAEITDVSDLDIANAATAAAVEE